MKLCIFCKKCDFSAPYHYSTLTYGEGDITCSYHIEFSAPLWNQDRYRTWILFAETCPKYEEAS